ncbi:LysR family transcriptional regulator [Bosea vestrisii]|uniref:LysR family transcriptional regulator n=1 Tax=Bosea vestrisii TaxID=151416 RepID=UPI0024DFEF11|nr:LysR family transcriptional regulator [Bosea vestrisii]WID95198.1 LysR family transcriptional regulator [Bosea vestrisii]
MPSHRGLEALRAFVETGSVSQAAERLGRTQPQVGRLLTALEEEVGFALFGRNSRPLTLTREGREFYTQVERVLIGHDGLQRYATQMRRGGREHVRVLTAPFIANAIVMDAIAALVGRSSHFTASIESRVRLDIETWVGQETFDLGITILPLSHPAFETEEFQSVEAVVAMLPNHPLAKNDVVEFEELVETEIIVTHPRSIIRQYLERLCRESGKSLKVHFEATNGVIACQLVARGLGCSLSDPFVARSSGVPGLVLRPFRPVFPIRYAFLYPVWQSRSRIVEQLADEIRRTAAETWDLCRTAR